MTCNLFPAFVWDASCCSQMYRFPKGSDASWSKAITFVVILLLAITAFSCSGRKDNSSSSSENTAEFFLKDIITEKAILSDHMAELTLTGKVEFDADKVISYVPLISGIVERTCFLFGDKVQKGQTLLDIRSADLSALQSELISTEAEVGIARREWQAAQSMYSDKILSERELLEAESKMKQAEAMLNRVKNDMTPYTPNDNGSFAIKSPKTGFIVMKNVSSGTPVSPEYGPLFVVADLSEVMVIANVYASDLQFVRAGMDVKITTQSYPGEIFSGQINTISQLFDPEDKVLKARIKMQNENLKLKPEMSVVIRLIEVMQEKMITVPSQALVFDHSEYYVVIAETHDKFQIKKVEVSGSYNENTFIRSGLTEGENVVVKNQLLIYEDRKNVKP